MRRKLIIIGTCVLVYVVYAVSTGGVAIERLKAFGGQRDVLFAEDLKSDLWIDPNHSGGGIPFLGFYFYCRLPCSLRVQIWDTEQKYAAITIETILVEYANGDQDTMGSQWRRDLTPYTQINSSTRGLIETPMMKLSDLTPKVVSQYRDCVVTLKGFLTTKSGEHVPFEVVEPFHYESEFRVYTFWQMIASV
jgi:hypothetical protein